MCSCSVGKIPFESISVDQLLNDSNLRQNIMASTVISQKGFNSKDPEAIFLYIHCINPVGFANAFRKYDLTIVTNEEVQALATLHKQGVDKQKYKVDFMKVVGDIPLSANAIQSGSCKVKFMGE